MTQKDLTIATIGHIDHGKSTLVGRLLYDSKQVLEERIKEMEMRGGNFAFLLDSFEEEQDGEMTIDIFYSRYRSRKYNITFIDDPGHLEFIKNMLTGVSQASGAVLVVSAKPEEGIQFQTRRHLQLVRLLGINQLIVIVNKMDTVGYDQKRFQEIRRKVAAILRKAGFKTNNIPFIPTSAFNGENVLRGSKNMPWYKGKPFAATIDAAFTPPKPLSNKPLRVIIQGSYQVQEEKIVFAKVEAGILKKGQSVVMQPSGITTKVLTIKDFDGEKTKAAPPEAVGLVLKDYNDNDINLQVLGDTSHPPRASLAVEGKIFLLTEEVLSKNEPLFFRCGTARVGCHVSKIISRIDSETGKIIQNNAVKVNSAEMADVVIQLDKPLAVENFTDLPSLGRFLLLRGNKNIAAGIILGCRKK